LLQPFHDPVARKTGRDTVPRLVARAEQDQPEQPNKLGIKLLDREIAMRRQGRGHGRGGACGPGRPLAAKDRDQQSKQGAA
jgi:hypothetical protein